ncbi:MAG: hypothetical protein U0228_15515 [Myxococcaceae bacterium]
MSRCGRTSQLEALVRGEVPGPVDADLRAHARQCAVCRHELNWLETESTLFRQRAGRDEVAHLWAGIEAKNRSSRLSQGRSWPSMLVAMAAAVVLAVVVGRVGLLATPVHATASSNEALETDALMSPALELGEEVPCSKLPSGVGFSCSLPVPASFIASR